MSESNPQKKTSSMIQRCITGAVLVALLAGVLFVGSWLFALAAVAIFAAFPRAMVVMARFLGIDAPVNMIFFLGFCFSLVIIYILTVSLSRMSTKMRRLTQIIALNEDRIKALEQRLDLQAGDERETAALTNGEECKTSDRK